VDTLKWLRMREGSLKLVTNAGRGALTMLRVTGLIHAFTLHRSVPDAITTDQHWHAALTAEGHSPGEWCREHGLMLGHPHHRTSSDQATYTPRTSHERAAVHAGTCHQAETPRALSVQETQKHPHQQLPPYADHTRK
jgi:hypothetical protein